MTLDTDIAAWRGGYGWWRLDSRLRAMGQDLALYPAIYCRQKVLWITGRGWLCIRWVDPAVVVTGSGLL
jgi:hypothetical protein